MPSRALFERVTGLLGSAAARRSVGRLAGGTAIAQAITVLASPLLTRLYDPEAFGLFAVYMSTTLFLNAFCSLRLEMAIPLPEEERTARQLVVVVAVATLGTAILVALVIAGGGTTVVGWLGEPGLLPFLWLVPVGMAAESLRGACKLLAVREQMYTQLAQNEVGQSVARNAGQAGLGLATPSALGLIVGDAVARLGAAAVLVRRVAPDVVRVARTTTSAELRALLSRYRRFPFFSAPATTLNTVTTQGPAVILLALFGPAPAGLYALTQRLLGMPLSLLGQSILHVYMGRAAALCRGGASIEALFKRNLARSLAIGVVVILPAGLVASLFVGPVFGGEWTEAATYVRIMLPAYILNFISTGVGSTLLVLERQDLQLAREVSRAALVLGGFTVVALVDAPVVTALVVLSAATSLGYIIHLSASWKAIRARAREDAGPVPPTAVLPED